ncbi:TIGR02757 family protein [Tenuifilaceae bacterium CYCD]|nr:TIGR02757 family protein [Tenuifilaceae bacterium CYCD]
MILPQSKTELQELLDSRYKRYANKFFLVDDPIQIPHRFNKMEDIEIVGMLTATIAWGNRKSILNSMVRLLTAMNNNPYEFVINYKSSDKKYLKGFVHRTFNADDCAAFIQVLNSIYSEQGGLRRVFVDAYNQSQSVADSINAFRDCFVKADIPSRTLKHTPNINNGSAAKRLNMYLRWLVRPSFEGVDFGLWTEIPTSALLIPLDVHSGRVARSLGLLQRQQNDFKAVEELTSELRQFDSNDPIKFDFALFGMGVNGEV